MKLSIRRGHWGLAAVLVAACAAAGCSQSASTSGTSGTKTTITEEDYFNTPGQIAALAAYSKAFEAAHPGVTVKRQYVPFADLDAKLLTQAAGQDLPNLLAVDNPFVSTMISTGQVVPISGLSGFSSTGYYPAVIDEGLSGGKYYSLPVAGANSIALIYNIAMFKAANLTPPKTWADLVSDAKALTTSAHYGIALTCEAAEDTTWQWEPYFWTNGGTATFSNVSGAPGVQALTLWRQLVSDGSASKSCLNWSQTPAASTQFIDGKAAMMVNGPWNFPTMNLGQPVLRQAVRGRSRPDPGGGTARRRPARRRGLDGQQERRQRRSAAGVRLYPGHADTRDGTATREAVRLPAGEDQRREDLRNAGRPEWSVYVNQTLFAHPRTLGLGVKYPKISQAVWTAIQAALSGSQSVQAALNTAQSQINTILTG